MWVRATLVAFMLLSLTPVGFAAEDLSTDRPDFVESSDVLDAGRFQLELGLSFERDREGGVRSRGRSTPALLRIGLGHSLEARIETDGLLRASSTDSSTHLGTRDHGAADVALGLKWHTSDGDEKAGTPSTAWLFHLDLATGSSPFRGQGSRPSVRFVAEWELPRDWSIGVMPGLARDTDPNGKSFVAGILALTASTSLAPGWRGFVELAGERLATKARGGSLVTFDAGLTCKLNADMQWDLSVQRGLTRFTPDLAFGVGLSARF